MSEPQRIQPPAQIAPYVEVLGVDGAIEFVLEFGGAELTLSKNPQARGRLVGLVGEDQAKALYQAAAHLPRRVPLCKPYIARVWRLDHDLPVAEIARKLHVSTTAVRRWLAKDDGMTPTNARQGRRPDPNQLKFDL